MTEPVNHVGKFGRNVRIDICRWFEHEGVNVRLHHAAEFFEDQMLVLHFVCKAPRLKQPLAVPYESVDVRLGRWQCGDINE
jgi:hypothetical protein